MSHTGDLPDRLTEFFDRFVASIRDAYSDPPLVGLAADEIDQVRVDQGVGRLPAFYKEYLGRMGRSAGPFLAGTDAFYPSILGVKEDGLELLAENGVVDLMSPDSVVFAMHQGYQLYWFQGGDADDPAVVMYVEGKSGINREWESFSSFLFGELQEELEMIRRYGGGIDNGVPIRRLEA